MLIAAMWSRCLLTSVCLCHLICKMKVVSSKWSSLALAQGSQPPSPIPLPTVPSCPQNHTLQGWSLLPWTNEWGGWAWSREKRKESKFFQFCVLVTQGSIVVGIDYDCRERMVYWTDVAGRTISRASLEPGAEPETVINSGQQLHPEDTSCFTSFYSVQVICLFCA